MVELTSIATVGTPFKYLFKTASGTGNGPLKWELSGVPGWLTEIVPGELAGTPSEPGQFVIFAKVTDRAGFSSSAELSIKVLPKLAVIDDSNLFTGTVGRRYNGQLSVTPGTGAPPFSWRGLRLPLGLIIDRKTGKLYGTPINFGEQPIQLIVEDAAGRIVDFNKSLLIKNHPPKLECPATVTFNYGLPNECQFRVNDGGGLFTWSSDGLPDGVALDPTRGRLFGVPVARGSYLIHIAVIDQFLYTDERDVILIIQ